MTLKEIQNRIAAIQGEVKAFNLDSLSTDDYAKLVALDNEKKGLAVDLEKAQNVERIKADGKAFDAREATVTTLEVAPTAPVEVKSFGVQFMSSPSAKVKGVDSTLNIDVKTLMTSTGVPAGIPVPSRGNAGVIVYQPTAPTTLLDVLESIPVNAAVGYRFYAETLYTNNADVTPEGGQYPESALKLTEQTAGIYKVTTYIPVTDEQLSDVPGAAQYIDSRLRDMVRTKASALAMSGNGTNTVLGVQNVPGLLTEAKGSDSVLDAIYKGIVKINAVGGPEDMRAVADLIVMNPFDWQILRLAKDTQGRYLLGDPMLMTTPMVWGLPVILDVSMALGTALVLDTRFFKIGLGADVTVQQTNSNGTDFVHGVNCVRAQIRMGLIPLRASAGCTVTGLDS